MKYHDAVKEGHRSPLAKGESPVGGRGFFYYSILEIAICEIIVNFIQLIIKTIHLIWGYPIWKRYCL